jgi:hypothetical protein
MTKLVDLYTDFWRIDQDSPGGFARVAQVKANPREGYPEFCAFKLMRHEITNPEDGLRHFEDELKILVAVTSDMNSPSTITKIYDSGFVQVELSYAIHSNSKLEPNWEIISTGKDIKRFLEEKSKRDPNQWLPYLLVELATYDDSLLRQIHNQPKEDPSGLFRMPTGEVILLAVQLLDVMEYLHINHHRTYIDWKPEHIFWNSLLRKATLIDWNVTIPFEDGAGRKQNIRDDLRLFCGAALYIPLTFVDPDDPTKPIGPRPTTDISSPVSEILRRYWTNNPDFYQRGERLDEKIKQIIQRGLDPKKGFDSASNLKLVLKNYAIQELGMWEDDFSLNSQNNSPYFKAIIEMRSAQQHLLNSQKNLYEAVKLNGKKLEFTRLFDVTKRALMNFPAS